MRKISLCCNLFPRENNEYTKCCSLLAVPDSSSIDNKVADWELN